MIDFWRSEVTLWPQFELPLEEQLGLEIPLRELFEHPTIAAYSDSIANILQSNLD